MTTTKFNKKVECCTEYVAIKILDNGDEIKVGNIYIPPTAESNSRLGFGIIESVGPDANEKYGLVVGDYVLFDRLSSFGHTAPICMLRYNNVICLTNKDRTEFKPLKNMCFVEPNKTDPVTEMSGIFVPNYKDKLNTGKVISTNFTGDNIPVKVGDTIVLSSGADVVKLGTQDIRIYKSDMIVAVVKE